MSPSPNPSLHVDRELFTAFVSPGGKGGGFWTTTTNGHHLYKTLKGVVRKLEYWRRRDNAVIRYYKATLTWQEVDQEGNLLEGET